MTDSSAFSRGNRWERMAVGLILTIIPFTFCAAAGTAPWRDLFLPGDGKVVELVSAGGALWAGTAEGKLYRSRTGREDWKFSLQRYDAPVSGIVGFGSAVYVGFGTRVDLGLWDCFSPSCVSPTTLGGLYRSGDGGATWTSLPLKAVTALHAYRDTLYAATLTGLYASRDGNAWTQLPANGVSDGKYEAVRALRRCGSDLFLLNSRAVQRCSLKAGTLVLNGTGPASPTSIAVVGHDVLINTETVLCHTREGSARWDTLASPRFSWIGEDSAQVLALPRDTIASFYSGSPDGLAWTAHPTTGRVPILGLCRHPGTLFAIGKSKPLYWLLESDIGGLPGWMEGGLGIYDYALSSLAARGDEIRTAKSGKAASFRHTSAGWAWDTAGISGFTDLLASGGSRFFATSPGGRWYVDNGSGWRPLIDFTQPIAGLAASEDWAAAYDDRTGTLAVCANLDDGAHCVQSLPPIPMRDPGYGSGPDPFGAVYDPGYSERLAAEGNLLVFARDSVFVSPDRGASWQSRGRVPDLDPLVIKVHDGRLYAAGWGRPTGTQSQVPAVAVSADTGRTWTRLGGHPPGGAPRTLAFRDGETFAATDSGVFRIAAGGGSWESLGGGLPYRSVRALAVSGDRLLAGLEEGSLWELTMPPVAIRARNARAPSPTRATLRADVFLDAAGSWRRIDGRKPPVTRMIR